MESHRAPYTLTELLCLMEFEKDGVPKGSDNSLKALLEWAEWEVLSGDDSEPLLILASLNLDEKPDAFEARIYLDRYLGERGLRYPGWDRSALVWLQIQLRHLITCESAGRAEALLSRFAIIRMDYDPRFFAKSCGYLNWLYDFLYEDYGEVAPSLASTMSEDAILAHIRQHLRPIEKVLSSEDWLRFLSSERSPPRITKN
nr:hypothetical protein [uncultured Enterobacter sp.]